MNAYSTEQHDEWNSIHACKYFRFDVGSRPPIDMKYFAM